MAYICAGGNCNPRMYLTRILGVSRAGGYGTLPFDLCITTFESIRACIETDFSEFFKDLRLIPGNNPYGDRSKAGPGLQSITNAYGMEFNHEGPSHSHLFAEGTNDDDFYVRNDFEKFQERYLRRIENFRKLLAAHDNITIVAEHTQSDQEKILQVFSTTYPTKSFQLVRPQF